MKGTLLLLSLLVTGELGLRTREAGFSFYDIYGALVLGNKQLLNSILSKFDPTDKEREAFEKIQECYNEGGWKSKLLDLAVVESIVFSEECRQHFAEDKLKIINLYFLT